MRTEALLYVTRHTNTDPLTLIEQVGDFPDFSIRASMIAFLARPGRAQNLEAAQLMLQRMVDESGDAGLRSRAEAARVIGLVPDVFDRELRKLLEDDAPEVAREAVRSAGLLAKRPLAHRLIDRIAEPWLTDDIVEALARMGDRVVGTIRDQMVDRDTPAAIRRELPAVLQAIGSPAAQHVLIESMLDADTVLRTRVLTALNKLVQLHPGTARSIGRSSRRRWPPRSPDTTGRTRCWRRWADRWAAPSRSCRRCASRWTTRASASSGC